MGETFDYQVVSKEGREKVELGTIQTSERLSYDSVLKLGSKESLALYRVVDIQVNESKKGIERKATVMPLVKQGTSLVAGTVIETSRSEAA